MKCKVYNLAVCSSLAFVVSWGLLLSGVVNLAGLVFPRCAAIRRNGAFGFGKIIILMPNKSVKGTARRSGW
jgi:hypothetical protein